MAAAGQTLALDAQQKSKLDQVAEGRCARAGLYHRVVDTATTQIADRGEIHTAALHELRTTDRTRHGHPRATAAGNIVGVRLGENDAQRNALRSAEEVVLRARLAAIGWVRSSFFPRAPQGPKSCRPRHRRSRVFPPREGARAALGAANPTAACVRGRCAAAASASGAADQPPPKAQH